MKALNCFILVFLFTLPLYAADSQVTVPIDKAETITVEKVKDGDSLKLANGQTLQLAGIRTPELHDTPRLPQEAKRFHKEVWQFRNVGDEAQRKVENFIKKANNEILVESASEAFDENQNLLGYAFAPVEKTMTPDGKTIVEAGGQNYVFLNSYLLQEGLAELSEPIDPKHQLLFTNLETQAKQEKKGLWS